METHFEGGHSIVASFVDSSGDLFVASRESGDILKVGGGEEKSAFEVRPAHTAVSRRPALPTLPRSLPPAACRPLSAAGSPLWSYIICDHSTRTLADFTPCLLLSPGLREHRRRSQRCGF